MNHGSLFSGIGGFDLAAEWMGWENRFHCEWNDFGQRVLKYYWPNAESYEDITKTDFTIWRGRIDILTGGFPCQPYSQAGKRLGKEDERHLWPEMLRAIREIQPSWVVGENVRGLVNWNGGMVFEEVQADLESEGYEVQPFLLPASGVGAPHQRERVWFVAYSNNGSGSRNTVQAGRQESKELHGLSRNASDTDNPRTNERVRDNGEREKKDERREGLSQPELGSISGNASDTESPRSQGERKQGQREIQSNRRGEQITQPTWEQFPTQPPVCGGDDGLPTELDGITFPKWRNESIKTYGNAVVPQVVLQIFKAIEAYEKN